MIKRMCFFVALIAGCIFKAEKLTVKKLIAVLALLCFGILLWGHEKCDSIEKGL